MNNYSIAIHGGAGTIIKSLLTPALELQYKQGLKDAISTGEQILLAGGSALDAVEASVKTLEDFPLFNAGKGAVFTHEGKHELDASIMDGSNLMAGAVAAVNNIKNPVSLAKSVMQNSEHVLLSANGAMEFAKKMNFELLPDSYFFEQIGFDQLQQAIKTDKIQLDHTTEDYEHGEKKFGTVGAVALDFKGNLAAATSTGGMTNKKMGRIGDTPIIGAGTYANNDTCAVSCTGHGEYFIRNVVAYDVSCLMEYQNKTLQEACNIVVNQKLVKRGGEGGLIAIDHTGAICLAFNSEGMYRASKSSQSELYIGIYK